MTHRGEAKQCNIVEEGWAVETLVDEEPLNGELLLRRLRHPTERERVDPGFCKP